MLLFIKTHGWVSAAKKQEIRAGTPVCYLCDRSSSQFQPIITQKLWHLSISTRSTYFSVFIYSTLHTKSERNSPSSS